MATIRKYDCNKSTFFLAIIEDKLGRPVVSKTFTRRVDATSWARRIESDEEEADALGTAGARMTFKQLADEYMLQWMGKDPFQQSYRQSTYFLYDCIVNL